MSMKQPPKTQVPAPACADTCIGLRRYLHEATQVSALKPHSFKGQRDRYVGSQGGVNERDRGLAGASYGWV